jgi:outer membrane receptor protein involved in Fe transport
LSAKLNYIHGWQVVTGDTFSINPRTLNELRANVVTQLNVTALDDTNYDSQMMLSGFGGGFPRVAITGQQSISFGPASEPSAVAKNSRVFSDNLTLLRGPHTIKVGAGIRAEEYDNQAGYYQQGNFSFNGIFTSNLQASTVANGFADFLLGLSSSVSAQLPTNRYGYRERNFYLFAQDDYKILPRLTINIGLRYEWYGGLYEAFNRGSEFSPYVANSTAEPFAPVGTLGGLVFAGPKNHFSFVNPTNNFLPRLGLAYQVNPKTVVRAGAGMYSAENNYAFGMSTLGFDPIPEALVTVNQIVPAMVLQNGNPQPLTFTTYAHTSGLGNNLGAN